MRWQTKKFLCQISATIWALLILTFSLLSGAQAGWRGVLNNIPNAIPAFIFLGIVLVVWIRPFAGGLLLILAAVSAFFFFSAWTNPVVLIVICVFPFLTGFELTHAVNNILFEAKS